MIAIIAAMDSEVNAIVECMDTYDKKVIHGIDFYEGKISNKMCVVMKSGVGKVFAALSTSILLQNFDIDFIINIGTAGGLKNDQKVLDALISTQVVQHDYDTSPVDGDEGIGLFFESDPKLVELASKVMDDLKIRAHIGLIASGDQFIAYDEAREAILNKFPNALGAEMEAGAVAHVATHFKVPFVVIRSLSDVTCEDDSHLDFLTYVGHAAKRSAELTKAFCENLG